MEQHAGEGNSRASAASDAESSARPSGCAPTTTASRARVNTAIRDLVVRGRLNATSVMVAAPSFNRSEAHRAQHAQRRRAARRDRTARHAHRAVQAVERRLRAAARRRVPSARRSCSRRRCCAASTTDALTARGRAPARGLSSTPFGRAPDFIDGHQHVHLFPQVSEAVLDVVKEARAGRLAAPMRTRVAAPRAADGPQGAAARRAEPPLPPPRTRRAACAPIRRSPAPMSSTHRGRFRRAVSRLSRPAAGGRAW